MTHNSVISKALAYSINYEQYLRTSLSGPRVPMNNNIAEQAIRLFTIGRKYFTYLPSLITVQRQAPCSIIFLNLRFIKSSPTLIVCLLFKIFPLGKEHFKRFHIVLIIKISTFSFFKISCPFCNTYLTRINPFSIINYL